MTSYRFSRWRISAILDCRGPVMGSLKSPCTTSYRSSIKTIALNCLVFEKIAFFCILATDKQTNKQTDGQHRCTKPLSLLSVRKLCHVPDRKPRPLPHIKPQAKHFTLVKFMLAAGAYSWHPWTLHTCIKESVLRLSYRCPRIPPSARRWKCSWGRRRPHCTPSFVRRYYTTVSRTETMYRPDDKTSPSLHQTTTSPVQMTGRLHHSTEPPPHPSSWQDVSITPPNHHLTRPVWCTWTRNNSK